MSKHNFSQSDFVNFATRHTLGGAIAEAEAIKRSGPRQGDDYALHSDGKIWLDGEALREYQSLKAKQYRKAKHEAKAARRAAEGKPYGQGCKPVAAVVVAERDPVERAPKYITVGKPKPHGAAPKGYVCKKYTA